MFWRFGGYANVSTIDTLLEKPDVTLEELLDESDLIQELKQHNTKLIEYLREDKVLEKLLEYVVAPKPEVPGQPEEPETKEEDAEASESKGKERSFSVTRSNPEDEEDEKEKKRNRYAYVSAEVLSSDNWSISESLMENQPILRKFWDFLKLSPPLDPLQASYFTKVNEALLDKKTEEMLDLFKSLDGAVKDMLQHVDSPMIMDLLLKIISLEKAEGGQGIVDWLHSQDLMPILLSFLSSEHSWATQTSAGDFLKAIITISANASQNEQSCIGPNELTRQLVSQPCIEKLISDMLKGGNPLTVGVGIVIEVIRKNNSDYDPDVGAEANSIPSSRDPIYLGTLLRMFAQHVPDFMELILSPNHTISGNESGPVTIRRKELSAAFGGKIEPLGFDRFKTCELMAELLHCSNMGLLNEIGSEEFVRARDLERERLKSEGKLGVSNDQSLLPDEDLTMKSSTQTRLGSPDGSRKLEVQNASDDDGFEEVTHSADLGDDAKDDFDEKPEEELPSAGKSSTPLSFLDKDDEDFVDEPLSSPRLNPDAALEPSHMDDPDLTPLPLSPTKELAKNLGSMDFHEEDTPMTSPPPSIEGTDGHLPDAEGSETSTVDSKETPDVTPDSSEESAESPPRKEAEKQEIEPISSESVPESIAETQQSVEALSPHPDDRPAPLFAAKKTEPSEESIGLAAEASSAPPAIDTSGETTETQDTTMGEAGESSNSMLMANADDSTQLASGLDQSVAPVVGDFLKMQFVEHKVVPTILDFFFRFPWNNFLHNVVYDVVQQVFNGPMDRGFNRTLSIDLFETGNITMRIVEGQKKSDEAQEKSKMRLGYMGHLTLIAEEVVKFTERHPPELLSESVLEKVMNTEWITYVEVTLAETRERDNAILGGVRPDMSVGPRQAVMNAVNAANNLGGASSALAEAGLNGTAGLDSIDLANGNNGASISNFTLTGGTLLSGFGSSSDEEDDEMDEDNEDEGSRNHSGAAEFSRYITTPSTTVATTSDLEPPSAPPPGVPPPPLNIPPSRARRQLAARLALHSKQATENNNSDSEDAEHRKNLNPFATEEDDDDDDDDEGDFTIGDLEAEAEGKGHLPPGTDLVGDQTDVGDILGGPVQQNDVGISLPPLSFSNVSERASFPTLWPFGQTRSATMKGTSFHFDDNDDDDDDEVDFEEREDIDGPDTSHFRGANNVVPQDSDSNSSDSDDGPGGFGNGVDGEPDGKSGRRRLSMTTEAKRRTSLDDEDDEEVVHVARESAMGGEGNGITEKRVEGEEELVEIQHAESAADEGTATK